ncbi:MAG: hypothetical protein WC385_03215 [Candidatus Paceibacterota bacterium]|jgi:hypothetical protein
MASTLLMMGQNQNQEIINASSSTEGQPKGVYQLNGFNVKHYFLADNGSAVLSEICQTDQKIMVNPRIDGEKVFTGETENGRPTFFFRDQVCQIKGAVYSVLPGTLSFSTDEHGLTTHTDDFVWDAGSTIVLGKMFIINPKVNRGELERIYFSREDVFFEKEPENQIEFFQFLDDDRKHFFFRASLQLLNPESFQ